ncbi:MAG TPA: SRPBCC family protein [Acidimicrobiales bacterium]|nr:SRPBCC family protein [Acidimicrobiales bacterium]
MTASSETTPVGRGQRLVYRGPPIEVLYRDYACRRRIDPAAPITASHEVVIDAPVQRVWQLLSRPQGWSDMDADISDVRLDGEVIEGAGFTWRNGRTRLTSRFAVVDEDRELTWTGAARGAKAVHRHVLTPTDDGRTRLFTEESMSGTGLVLFFSSAKLRAALEKWLSAIAAAAR